MALVADHRPRNVFDHIRAVERMRLLGLAAIALLSLDCSVYAELSIAETASSYSVDTNGGLVFEVNK